MLDVHPPHHAAHTWREFLLHIATITVGLLIAVGLEQTVEYVHHRHQIAETREALHAEREKNYKLFALQTRVFEQRTPYLEMNLKVLLYLRGHPNAPRASWPGEMVWHVGEIPFVSAAWATAQRDGVIERLPSEYVERLDELYKRLDQVRADELAERAVSEEAGGFYARSPDIAKASERELDKLIDLATQLLIAHARIGIEQRRLAARFPDFPSGPGLEAIDRMLASGNYSPEDRAATDTASREFFSLTGDTMNSPSESH